MFGALTRRSNIIKKISLFSQPHQSYNLLTNGFNQGRGSNRALLSNGCTFPQDKNAPPHKSIETITIDTILDNFKKLFSEEITNKRPPKVLFKILNPESEWDRVPLAEVEDVIGLKEAIKNRVSPLLNNYAVSTLNLKATKKIDDANQGINLDGRKDLASILKDFQVEIPATEDVVNLFADNIWLFVSAPTVSLPVPAELEKKRNEELLPEILKKKKWNVNGPIRVYEANSVYYVDPAEHMENQGFLASIKGRQLVMLMGSRASGKSTRLYRLMSQLAEDDYHCFLVSLEEVIVTQDEDTFWRTMCKAIRRSSYSELKDIKSSEDFLETFAQSAWKNQKIVLFIDEFDKLYHASYELRNQVLETLRVIRNHNHAYAIHSIVACGTFKIQHLNSTDMRVSPFNVAEYLKNPHFTFQQTQRLFDEFAQDEKIIIDHDIVDDIYTNSNGHPGMVCLCGCAIADNLLTEVNETKNLSYKAWKDFSTDQLDEMIHDYHRGMVNLLISEQAMDAVKLLRSRFVGFLGNVPIFDDEEEKQADFLTAEGVLLKPKIDGNRYCMASAFIDSLIRQHVIPKMYPNAPSTPVPKLSNGINLDVPNLMKIALQFFDREYMKSAANNAYKSSNELYVGGSKRISVARESVYNSELMRILKNWLSINTYQITGQWHLLKEKPAAATTTAFPQKSRKSQESQELEYDNMHCDIVIKRPKEPTVILKLLATRSSTFIQDHIDKTLDYKTLIKAEEAWVIHFTCQDQYLQNPHWQSEGLLNQAVNMIHFWHDRDFTEMMMSARWKDLDGKVQQVNNERVF